MDCSTFVSEKKCLGLRSRHDAMGKCWEDYVGRYGIAMVVGRIIDADAAMPPGFWWLHAVSGFSRLTTAGSGVTARLPSGSQGGYLLAVVGRWRCW